MNEMPPPQCLTMESHCEEIIVNNFSICFELSISIHVRFLYVHVLRFKMCNEVWNVFQRLSKHENIFVEIFLIFNSLRSHEEEIQFSEWKFERCK